MTLAAPAFARMMAKPAFQGLQTRAKQLATVFM